VFFVSLTQLRDGHLVSLAAHGWLVVVATPGDVELANEVSTPSWVDLVQNG
jgi:hypothetical protein